MTAPFIAIFFTFLNEFTHQSRKLALGKIILFIIYKFKHNNNILNINIIPINS